MSLFFSCSLSPSPSLQVLIFTPKGIKPPHSLSTRPPANPPVCGVVKAFVPPFLCKKRRREQREAGEIRRLYMGAERARYAIILLCHLFLRSASGSGSIVTRKEAVGYANELAPVKKYQPSSPSGQKDITNPVTTVPTIIPAPFASTDPGLTDPVVNPTSNPESAPPTVMTPTAYPATVTSPPSLSSSWCIASQSVSQTTLQVALDYACGYGGADCSAIQPGGSCYYPNTVRDHASYAFNKYYQKNPVPTSCSFGGTAVVTSTDPSTSTCEYQSTSTASSILNTTNSSGATVFGAVPSGPTTSSASQLSCIASLAMTLSWLSFASRIH